MEDGRQMAGNRAVLLYRVSSGGQDEANQVPDVERYAGGKGYRWSERYTYTLHDKSAYKGEQQATLDRIIADVRAGMVKVLVVWHSSRIERRELEYLLRFIREVKEAGGRIESVQEGLLDGHNLNTIIGGYMNHDKSLVISASVQLAHNRIRDNSAFRGRDPFGYEISGAKYSKKLTVIEPLRPIVQEIFARVIRGESLADICTWLDSLKVKQSKTTTKKYLAGEITPWWPAMLMRLIRHPAYSGRYYVRRTDDSGKTVTYTHSCEAIVTRSIQRQAIEALSTREKRGPRGSDDTRAMLKGVITCPFCDDSPMYRMTGRLAGGRQEYYRCYGRGPQRKGCGNMVPMSTVDDAVNQVIADAFSRKVTVTEIVKGHDWSEEIDAVKDELRRLGDEGLTDDEYDVRHAELTAERNRLKLLPALDDEEKTVELDERYSELYARLERSERGAWLKAYGFTVQASKARVVVSQGERSADVEL